MINPEIGEPEMAKITRVFTRDELEELDLPHNDDLVVHTMQIDEKRWATVHECVFHTEDDEETLWRVRYYRPATEATECNIWGYGTEPASVEAVMVEPYQVEVTRYRAIEDAVDVAALVAANPHVAAAFAEPA